MTFFNSGTFWFIEGILFTVMLLAFRAWMQDRGTVMTWWKWSAFVVWVFLAGGVIAFVGTSLGENEPAAALRGGLLFGVIVIIAGAGLWRLLHRGAAADGPTTANERPA